MRIVGGDWRGRPIDAPSGRDVTRPTTDRTREAMASMVFSAFGLDMSDVSVLDAFAGSGAIGLEMLSRGAAHCTFVDQDRKAQALVRKNLASLKAPAGCATVVGGDVLKLASRAQLAGAPFSLVVLDPPYALEASLVSDLVKRLADGGLLAPGALVLYERDARREELAVPGFEAIKTKAHGTTAFTLFRMGE